VAEGVSQGDLWGEDVGVERGVMGWVEGSEGREMATETRVCCKGNSFLGWLVETTAVNLVP